MRQRHVCSAAKRICAIKELVRNSRTDMCVFNHGMRDKYVVLGHMSMHASHMVHRSSLCIHAGTANKQESRLQRTQGKSLE